MIKFLDKRKNVEREAFEIREAAGRIFVRFSEGGKEYGFARGNIEIIAYDTDEVPDKFRVYAFKQPCYKCKQNTKIYTYMLFADGTDQDLVFPWDKHRLNREKSAEAIWTHMTHPEIEFYPIKVIGDDEWYDRELIKAYPEQIHYEYSSTQGREYAMNLCEHCKAKQGQFFIYARINQMVQKVQNIEVVNFLDI